MCNTVCEGLRAKGALCMPRADAQLPVGQLHVPDLQRDSAVAVPWSLHQHMIAV